MGLGFAALGLLPLPENTAIGYASPLLVVILAAMFLGEQVRAFRLTAVAIGLVGVLIVLSPRLTTLGDAPDVRMTLGAVLALGGALFSALATVFVRKMVQVETVTAIVFYFSVNAALLSLVTLPWGWVAPSPWVAVMLVGAGILGGIGQILMTTSYRYADASVIAPFEYASMLFSLVIGYFIFDEAPTLVMLGGAALVMLAGVIIILREHQLGLERDRQRQAAPTGI